VGGGHGDSLVAVVQYVAEHYRESIGAHDIARAVGRHPNDVSTLFRQKGGYRLMDYVNRLRVCHAQQLLMTTEMTILDIALDSGFGSLSRFYSVFKEACGATPRLYRRLHLPPGLRQQASASG
jgi:transcriptional regulator GlxA family with amidase domain